MGKLLAPIWKVVHRHLRDKYSDDENNFVLAVDTARRTLNIVDKTCGIVVHAFRVDATGPVPIVHPIDNQEAATKTREQAIKVQHPTMLDIFGVQAPPHHLFVCL